MSNIRQCSAINCWHSSDFNYILADEASFSSYNCIRTILAYQENGQYFPVNPTDFDTEKI